MRHTQDRAVHAEIEPGPGARQPLAVRRDIPAVPTHHRARSAGSRHLSGDRRFFTGNARRPPLIVNEIRAITRPVQQVHAIHRRAAGQKAISLELVHRSAGVNGQRAVVVLLHAQARRRPGVRRARTELNLVCVLWARGEARQRPADAAVRPERRYVDLRRHFLPVRQDADVLGIVYGTLGEGQPASERPGFIEAADIIDRR